MCRLAPSGFPGWTGSRGTPVLDGFRERILERQPLRLRGGGSKDFYGGPPAGAVLDTRGYAGIVHYEPDELVVTARCGTPLAELEAALAERRQCLAFAPPHFGAATVGGMVAAGLSGPSRAAVGGLRDQVLGIRIMDGEGRVLRFGGVVMKNVAGFDVSRLMAGSLGTLGLILEASLKVLPRPAAEASRRFALTEAQALTAVNRWAGQPLPLAASAWQDGVLTVRLAGASAAVAAAGDQLGGEPLDPLPAQAFWQGLREQTAGFFAGAAPLWRLSVPATTPPLGWPGPMLIEWFGAQRWVRGEFAAAHIRALAVQAGGYATLFRGGDRRDGVFTPLSPAVLAIHRRLKQGFDPHGVFNPGRLFPEF